METQHMPRYDVRNDGTGPYAVFYCDQCEREFRSQPDVRNTVTREVGKRAVGGLLRNIPLVGSAVANSMDNDDLRYRSDLTPQELQSAWKQVEMRFHVCPTCGQIVCPSCWDAQANTCVQDSPRSAEIAEAQAEQAAGVVKGIASAFGLGAALRGAAEAAQQAQANTVRCPKDGTIAPAGTKFCPECGEPLPKPAAADTCPKCGAEVKGAKFCPECGTKIERAAATPTHCSNCGAELKGAKFCPECGTKAGS